MIVKFKEIADYVAGQSPESKYYSNTEGIPFLQGNRTFGLFYPTIDTYTKKITKIAKKGDILMSVRAPVGDLNIAKEDLCIGRGLSAISSKTGNNIFLFYSLKYNIQNLIRQSSGTTFDSITRDVIENMNMIIPDDKSIHLKISKLLFDIDLKIDINNKINAELESMAKTLYDYWFLQFEFPNEEGKPYKSSGGKMVWNENLKKEIPEGWEVNKIAECLVHINTGLNPRDHFVLNDGKIKYVTVKNLTTTGELDFSGCDTISESTKKLINKRSMISPGDILFASIAPLGRCFIIRETPHDWEINESVFSIRTNHKISSEYLYQHFMSDYFVKKAEHSSTGSVFAGIRISTLNDMDIVIPPKVIIDKFTNKLTNIYKLKYGKSKENQELTSLRDFLLPMLMNGQVTFK